MIEKEAIKTDIKHNPSGMPCHKRSCSKGWGDKLTNNQIHILNAQSPAATCSLAVADYIIENYIK